LEGRFPPFVCSFRRFFSFHSGSPESVETALRRYSPIPLNLWFFKFFSLYPSPLPTLRSLSPTTVLPPPFLFDPAPPPPLLLHYSPFRPTFHHPPPSTLASPPPLFPSPALPSLLPPHPSHPPSPPPLFPPPFPFLPFPPLHLRRCFLLPRLCRSSGFSGGYA